MMTKSRLMTVTAAAICLAACADVSAPVGTAGMNKRSDGSVVINLNGRTKTCTAGQIPVAAGAKTTVVTVKGTKIYPKGLLACLDPKAFGGAAVVGIEGSEVVVKPAQSPATP